MKNRLAYWFGVSIVLIVVGAISWKGIQAVISVRAYQEAEPVADLIHGARGELLHLGYSDPEMISQIEAKELISDNGYKVVEDEDPDIIFTVLVNSVHSISLYRDGFILWRDSAELLSK